MPGDVSGGHLDIIDNSLRTALWNIRDRGPHVASPAAPRAEVEAGDITLHGVYQFYLLKSTP
jgi:hypothetical protein